MVPLTKSPPPYEEATMSRDGVELDTPTEVIAREGRARCNKPTLRNSERELWDERRQRWNGHYESIASRTSFWGLRRWEVQREPTKRIDQMMNWMIERLPACKLQAVFDFDAETLSDLSFSRGQGIWLISVSPNETWLEGSYVDVAGRLQTGTFPASACLYKVKAMHGHDRGATGVGPLTFDDGQIIEVMGIDVYQATKLWGRYTEKRTGIVRAGSFPRELVAPYHPIIATDLPKWSAAERSAVRSEEPEPPARTTQDAEMDTLVKTMSSTLGARLEKDRGDWISLAERVAAVPGTIVTNERCRMPPKQPSNEIVRGWLYHDIVSTVENMDSLDVWLDLELQQYLAIEGSTEEWYWKKWHDVRAVVKRMDILTGWLARTRKDYEAKEKTVSMSEAYLQAAK